VRALPQSIPGTPDATTQRLIVKFHSVPSGPGAATESARGAGRVSRLAADGGVALAYVRPMALGAHVVALDHPVPLSQARAIARRLAGHAEVEYVQPDHRMRAQRVPNDEDLNLQTYLRDSAAGISAFSAWDVTTGSADLWWAAPSGLEAGWGINLTHEGDTIFATWYTYDHDRSPMWLVATATKSGLSSYTGT